MQNDLLNRTRAFARELGQTGTCPPLGADDIANAELALEVSIPPLLAEGYKTIGNGGFGPGGGVIGIGDGHASDLGDLTETFRVIERDQHAMGAKWEPGMLPFVGWGCAIFSCVDCHQPSFPVHTLEEGELSAQVTTLNDFFERWLAGEDLFQVIRRARKPNRRTTFINPFTRKEEELP